MGTKPQPCYNRIRAINDLTTCYNEAAVIIIIMRLCIVYKFPIVFGFPGVGFRDGRQCRHDERGGDV